MKVNLVGLMNVFFRQKERNGRLEREKQELWEQLQAELIGSLALQRQIVQYSDIAERYRWAIGGQDLCLFCHSPPS